MKFKQLSSVALATLALSVLSSGAFAANQADVVAKVVSQSNQVLAENAEGSRRLLTVGSEVLNNEHIIVLENSSVQLQYASSQCKVTHGANELVKVSEASQCAAGQKIAVGQGAASIGVVNAAGAPSSGAGAKTKMGLGGFTAAPLVFVGAIAVLAVADDDDDPVSR